MINSVFTQALREYLRFRRLVPWMLLSVLCLILAATWQHLDKGASTVDRYALVSSILVFRLLALASAIFTTAIVSQEVEQRTIVYLLTRPVPRWQLLLVRYLASVVVVTLLGIFASLLSSMGAYGGGLASNPLLGRDAMALFVGALAYGALFLMVSLLFNRALIICTLFAFGWESSVPSLPGDIYRLSVYSYLQPIANHPTSGGSGLLAALSNSKATDITQTTAFLVLGAATVLLLAAAAWWFTHNEYVAREDAE